MNKAIILGLFAFGASQASAQSSWLESQGSDFNIGYLSMNSSGTGTTSDGYYFNGRSSVLLGGTDFGLTLNTGSSSVDDGTTTIDARSFGLVAFYQPSPVLRLGIFGDAAKLESGAISSDINNFGVEGSFAINDMTAVSGYIGRYDTDLGFAMLESNFGLRVDVALNDRFSLYGAYEHDKLSGATDDLSSGSIGASYQVATVMNRPVNIDLGLTRFEQTGNQVDSIRIGVSVPLLTTFRDTRGWQGGVHGAYLGLFTGE
jgi:hypothetical protein